MNFVHSDGSHSYLKIPVHKMAFEYYTSLQGREVFARLDDRFWGGLISLLMEKKPYSRMVLRKRTPMNKITVYLPKRYEHAFVSEDSLKKAATLIEDRMEQMMCSFIHGASLTGSSESFAVKTFLDTYNIDSMSFDNARMIYRRQMASRKIALN